MAELLRPMALPAAPPLQPEQDAAERKIWHHG